MKPGEVLDLYNESRMDYIAMAGYVRAEWDYRFNNFDVNPPKEVSRLPI